MLAEKATQARATLPHRSCPDSISLRNDIIAGAREAILKALPQFSSQVFAQPSNRNLAVEPRLSATSWFHRFPEAFQPTAKASLSPLVCSGDCDRSAIRCSHQEGRHIANRGARPHQPHETQAGCLQRIFAILRRWQ
jgi:hypothetical protein